PAPTIGPAMHVAVRWTLLASACASMFLPPAGARADELFDAFIDDVGDKPAAPAKPAPPSAEELAAVHANIIRNVYRGLPDLATIHGTTLPKPTADAASFTKRYTLELERFGIHANASHPVETSQGINAALAYASQQGFN